jgi:glycosyltransferase involved in cell wall biosynthesis
MQTAMRIIHVNPFYTPWIGGGTVYMRALSERLARRGHDVTLLTQRRRGPLSPAVDRSLPPRERIAGVEVRRVLPSRRRVSLLKRILLVRGGWRLLRTCVSEVEIPLVLDESWSARIFLFALLLRPDVVTVMNFASAAWAHPIFLAKRLGRFPLVGIPLLHTEQPWASASVIGDLLHRCDALLLNTTHERDFVLSQGCHPARSHVLGPGVEPGLFSRGDGADFRRRHRIGDAPLVGYVGRVEPLKGVVTLVEAMRIVWTQQPAAHLLIAGQSSPGSPEERACAKALDALSEAERRRVVRLDGFDEADKASLLAALDLLVMPSVVESFGLTYLEAWACRKPVVGARVAAVECVIDHGVDGFLVRPHDRDETAAAISALLSDPDLRERMGTAGHRKVIAMFTWEPIVDAVEAL